MKPKEFLIQVATLYHFKVGLPPLAEHRPARSRELGERMKVQIVHPSRHRPTHESECRRTEQLAGGPRRQCVRQHRGMVKS